MAASKKPSKVFARKPQHSDAEHEHPVHVYVTFHIGPLEYGPRTKKAKGSRSPKEVRAFLAWALENL